MREEVREAIGCIMCKDCIYFSVKAHMPDVESKCKRLDHKKYKFAVPWFKCYDCGMTHQTICRDFAPNGLYKYLYYKWTDFDDWVGEIPDNKYVGLTLDGDNSVRYYVKYRDFAEGTHIKEDGSLNWVRKCYYKRTKKDGIGYKLVWEYNNKVVTHNLMTIKRLISLDCREEENRKIIQEELKKIKPLAKYSGEDIVPLEKVEKLVMVISKKYKIHIREIVPDTFGNNETIIWRSAVINGVNIQATYIYGLSLYEVLVKTAIYMYRVMEAYGRRQDNE